METTRRDGIILGPWQRVVVVCGILVRRKLVQLPGGVLEAWSLLAYLSA